MTRKNISDNGRTRIRRWEESCATSYFRFHNSYKVTFQWSWFHPTSLLWKIWTEICYYRTLKWIIKNWTFSIIFNEDGYSSWNMEEKWSFDLPSVREDLKFLSSNGTFILWNHNWIDWTRFVIWEQSFFSNILCYKLLCRKKLNIYHRRNI